MNVDEIAEHLQELGLDEREAEIYLLLLQNGPSRAGDVVALTDASRGKVYAALKELCQRGIASKTPERPAIYEARPPEALFDLASRELERRRTYVELLRNELLESLRSIETDAPSPDPDWSLLDGRSTIFDNLLDELDEAETSIETLSTHEICGQRVRPVEVAWQTLARRADEGVDVRVLVTPDPGVREFADGYGGTGGMQVRPLDLDRTVHFVVVDRRIVFYWVVASERTGLHRRDDVAVRTDAHALVNGAVLLHEALWSSTEGRELLGEHSVGSRSATVEGR